MTEAHLVMRLTTIEVAQLSDLVATFADLVAGSADADVDDPALARLAPDAYPDDPEAGSEFRRLTRGDLLDRRREDAGTVLRILDPSGDVPSLSALDDETAALPRTVSLDSRDVPAWMRTLAAVRLVLASRLGIEHEGDTGSGDPRFVLYEWVGVLLDAIVRTVDGE